ncbi:hypothetical protein BKA70DRAFT_1098975, partial [Coprinopsis sp. MPI-PUGE-AT-0042]
WTDVHSQFLQMGGYIFKFKDGHGYIDMKKLFEPSRFRKEWDAKAMRQALLQRQDRVEELMDKSKTNLLARTIAYSQMLWFCTNFIGRLVEGLTITKLEVASLAYVAMTLAAYYFWMDKPLDVDCPIIVAEGTEGSFGNLDTARVEIPQPDKRCQWCRRTSHCHCPQWSRECEAVGTYLIMRQNMDFLQRFDEESQLARSLSAFSYAAFGGIHCIAWNFAPYSEVEQWLWRVASVAVAAVPLLVPSLGFLSDDTHESLWRVWVFLVLFPGFLVFIPARMIILILPFLELTHLPADAFKTVSWDDFFPHIG